MNKKTKNVLTTLLGIIIIILTTFLFYSGVDLVRCAFGYVIGTGLIASYTKLFKFLQR